MEILSENETKRLDALIRYEILDTPAEQTFDDFAFLASTICGTPIAAISLVDSTRQWFKAQIGLNCSETPREHAFCGHTILGQDVMIVEDTACDERFAQNPLVTGDPHIRFYAGAPLRDSRGNALGAICVIGKQPRKLTEQQTKALSVLSKQIMAQFELRRTSSELASALSSIKTLHGLLPICSHCKGIRDDKGYWQSVEIYVSTNTEVDFTHCICPDCLKKHHPKVFENLRAAGKV